MPEIKIDAATAQLMGDVCAEIAKVAGISAVFAPLVSCAVGLGARLLDGGYPVPSLDELQRLQDDIAALPELAETAATSEA